MKSIVFYLLGCFFIMSTICCAQKQKAIDSVPRPGVEKFPGIWKWTSDSAELIIYLKKVTGIFPGNVHESTLVGFHFFKKNGIVIEDHLADTSLLNSRSQGTIFLMAKNYGANPDEVDGTIKDSLKNKDDYLSLVLNNTTTPSITMYLNNMSSPIKKRTKQPADYTFTFPSNIILVKQ